MTNTQVLLTRKDDGLPLVVDELVGVSTLKVVDELDEVAVAVLAMVLGAQLRQLTLALDVVGADLALHQFSHEKIIPQRHLRCTRNVGTVVGDVQRRRVIDMQRRRVSICSGTLPKFSPKPSPDIMLEQNTASSFIARAVATSSASIVDCTVSPCSLTLKMVGASVSVTMYNGVNLSWPPCRTQSDSPTPEQLGCVLLLV